LAFPTVAATAVRENTSNSTSQVANLPAGIASGDLLLVIGVIDGSGTTVTWPAGWNELDQVVFGACLTAGYRIATGGEASTISITSPSETSIWRAFRLTGWHGTTPPEISAPVTISDEDSDPPSLTASWGAEDNWWLTFAGIDAPSYGIAVYPSGYTGELMQGPAGGVGLASCYRESAAATENPAAFQWDTATNPSNQCYTLAVRPAAAPAGRATKNTRSNPLGVYVGMGHRMNL
jgi:hypothetical protein